MQSLIWPSTDSYRLHTDGAHQIRLVTSMCESFIDSKLFQPQPAVPLFFCPPALPPLIRLPFPLPLPLALRLLFPVSLLVPLPAPVLVVFLPLPSWKLRGDKQDPGLNPESSSEFTWVAIRLLGRTVGAGSDFLLSSHPPPTISIPVLIPCSAPTAVMEARDDNVRLGARTKPSGCLSVVVLDPRPGIPTILVRIVYVAVVEVPRTS